MTFKTIALPVLCVAVLLGGCGGGGGGGKTGPAAGSGGSSAAGPSTGSNPPAADPGTPNVDTPDDSAGGDSNPLSGGDDTDGDANNNGGSGSNNGGSNNNGGSGSDNDGSNNNGGSGSDSDGSNNSGGSGSDSDGSNNSGGSDNNGDAGSGDDDTGSGDNDPISQDPPTAEGVYAGELTNGVYTHFKTLILEDGSYWTLYGEETSSFFSVFGFQQGSGVSNAGSFTVNDLRDFATSPSVAGSVAATYDANAGTVTGSFTLDGEAAIAFAGGAIVDVPYEYDTPASMSDITGLWVATDIHGYGVSFDVAADGAVTVTQGDCEATGTLEPRASGKNVFDISVTFGPGSCELANQTATGVAITYLIVGSAQTQLMAALVSQSREEGLALFANR